MPNARLLRHPGQLRAEAGVAEGLAGCWMAGPMIAKPAIEELLGIHAPWKMLGGIALGYPGEEPTKKPRKPVDKVVTWFEAK